MFIDLARFESFCYMALGLRAGDAGLWRAGLGG
jgi:hypothetical protein